MDLGERSSASAPTRRHPWEIARASFLVSLLTEGVRLGSFVAAASGAVRSFHAAACAPAARLRVLDVGSGDGYLARALLARADVEVHCVDSHFSQEDISRLQSVQGLTASTTMPEGLFDALLLLDVLEHVDDDEAFLADALSRLRKGGLVLVSVPAWPLLFSAHDARLQHRRRYTPEACRALLATGGVDILYSGGFFHSLLFPRAVEVMAERLGRPLPPRSVASWNQGDLITESLLALLRFEQRGSYLLARRGLQVPGLSFFAFGRRTSSRAEVPSLPSSPSPTAVSSVAHPPERGRVKDTAVRAAADPSSPPSTVTSPQPHCAEPGSTTRRVVVVPCFNEAERLDSQALVSLTARPHTDLLLVDDGSTDATPLLLRRLARHHAPHVRTLSLPRNVGKAEAVRQGMLLALDEGAQHVAFLDADLSTPVQEIVRLLDVLALRQDVDVVLGARVALLGHDIHRKAMRHYMGRVFATAASLTLHVPVYDTQCGAKAFRATPAFRVALAQPFSSRWAFDVELLARLLASIPPQRFLEVPLGTWRDVAGSKFTGASMVRTGLDLARLALATRRHPKRRHPGASS
jgi:dolichyl-phosphate beta-glucosyltransferase